VLQCYQISYIKTECEWNRLVVGERRVSIVSYSTCLVLFQNFEVYTNYPASHLYLRMSITPAWLCVYVFSDRQLLWRSAQEVSHRLHTTAGSWAWERIPL